MNAAEMEWLRLPLDCDITSLPPAPGLSQRKCFELDPARYLARVLAANEGTLPGLVVAEADAMRRLAPVLERHGYTRLAALENCMVQADDSILGTIEVFEVVAG
jgi:hypothetical protein